MADITMCRDDKCQHAAICWRYNAHAGPMQSWFSESPRRGDECPEFIECRSKSQIHRLNAQTESPSRGGNEEKSMKCPKCETEISAVYSVPPEQEFRYSITLKEDQAMLHAETLGGSITAMRKLLCEIAKQTGQEVEVFIKGIEYGNPINIDFVILHKAKR